MMLVLCSVPSAVQPFHASMAPAWPWWSSA
ncbi:hypothetical protein RLOC_00010397 [Lonchura striata]|uniref:Uncharacterized protein n=1 Tax=Lonchura striata TaxID=40157 RepID=A0A218V6X7_9PASE|nr:hypothetical protein RLOC_00010397 [Lonchura striata domestica]